MSVTDDEPVQAIAELEATLRLQLPDIVRQQLEATLRTLRGGQAIPDGSQGVVNVGDDARHYGPSVGVNFGTIIYGRTPEEDERRRLVWYLDRLSAKLYHLPVRGLDETLERGNGVSLPQVYVMLATTNRVEVAHDGVALFPSAETIYR